MSKKDDKLMGVAISCIIGGIIIGWIIGFGVSNTEGIETIATEVLDSACQEIAGEEYHYVDADFGSDSRLICQKDYETKRKVRYDGIVVINPIEEINQACGVGDSLQDCLSRYNV